MSYVQDIRSVRLETNDIMVQMYRNNTLPDISDIGYIEEDGHSKHFLHYDNNKPQYLLDNRVIKAYGIGHFVLIGNGFLDQEYAAKIADILNPSTDDFIPGTSIQRVGNAKYLQFEKEEDALMFKIKYL